MKIKIFLTVLAVILLMGCIKDVSDKECLVEGEVNVEMNLSDSSGTRSVVEEEDKLYTVDVLVFKSAQSGLEKDAVFEYANYAWQKSGSTYRTVLTADSELNIYVAVNCRDLIDNVKFFAESNTLTYEKVCEMMRSIDHPQNFDIHTTGLPMWGKILGKSISADSSYEDLGTVRLLRSVASADVAVIATDFILEKVYVVHGADQGYVPFDKITPDDLSADFKADGANEPSFMLTRLDWFKESVGNDNRVYNQLYMYENGFDGTGDNRYSKIVLEGKWSPDGGATWNNSSYYPLSFRNTDKDSPNYGHKLQILRNMKFDFMVTKVNGDGYPDLEEAKEGEDVNVDFDVIVWDSHEDGNIIIDKTHYFSISEKKAVLGPNIDSEKYIFFTTDYPNSQIKLRFDPASPWASVTWTERFNASIETEEESGKRYIRITALKPYGTIGNPATLYLLAGDRIELSISVKQDKNAWNGGGNIEGEF